VIFFHLKLTEELLTLQLTGEALNFLFPTWHPYFDMDICLNIVVISVSRFAVLGLS
jgi:hypothetical protein